MKKQKILALVLAGALSIGALTGCGQNQDSTQTTDLVDGLGEAVSFRPVDCGIQAKEQYQFPFLGMELTLAEELREQMDTREVFAYSQEDYTDQGSISYGLLRFCATTEEQRAQEGMSVDLLEWQASLSPIGAIGVYAADQEDSLTKLTGCDTHEKLGQSANGEFSYYLSLSSQADGEQIQWLKESVIQLVTVHEFDASLGYNAFSQDRIEGIATLGTFETQDVFGERYTQEWFQDYDLTLVNVFATWCSPCVQEMPELEKLRAQYAQAGIKLGVVAVVLDGVTDLGVDEDAVERAKTLHDRAGAQFPFLLPDETAFNGRLTGIEAVPESFFVDSKGNIVSEAYVGANSLEEWSCIVDEELAKLPGGQA